MSDMIRRLLSVILFVFLIPFTFLVVALWPVVFIIYGKDTTEWMDVYVKIMLIEKW
jgi:hypothetical protein